MHYNCGQTYKVTRKDGTVFFFLSKPDQNFVEVLAAIRAAHYIEDDIATIE